METSEIERVGFSMEEIDRQLDAIKTGTVGFMILIPSEEIPIKGDGCVCSFVQICREEYLKDFHFEVSITKAGQRSGSVIYGKDRVST